MGKVIFIHNQKSGKGRDNTLEKLTKEGKLRGFEIIFIPFFDFLENNYSVSLKESEAIFAIGGDGTVNGVIERLVNLGINFPPLVVYPGGTSNDFASIWWSKGKCDPKKAFDAVERRNIFKVDLGEVNGRYFINVAGIGMFVDVASETSSARKQKWGFLAYLSEGIKRFPYYHPLTFTLDYDGKKEEVDCYLMLVLNGRGAGGLNNLIPDTSMDDGLLEVFMVKASGGGESKSKRMEYSILTLFPKVFAGTHLKDKRILHYRLKNFSVNCSEEMKLVVDGEPGTKPTLNLSFSVRRKAIPLLYN